MPDLTELRRLAEALIDPEYGGRWSATHGPRELPRIWADDQGVTAVPIFVAKSVEDAPEAQFVASANPAVVLELLDAAEALERVKALHHPTPAPTSIHYRCEPSECDQAGDGELRDECDNCREWYPCSTIRTIEGTDHA
ncbi:Uncharacterised protein [Mycobacteroides abscessus subsp. abscessus]|nr:Uncharacterised protein [Mycobacteroides abscessus subsp. abscessus]